MLHLEVVVEVLFRMDAPADTEDVGWSRMRINFNVVPFAFPEIMRIRQKILDLEWAGWGMPHQDLVSALKGASKELEMRCLEEFSRRQGNGPLERDLNIYRFCGIQRALLDAGFIGMQTLDERARTPKWFPSLINDSCAKALELSRLLEISKI